MAKSNTFTNRKNKQEEDLKKLSSAIKTKK